VFLIPGLSSTPEDISIPYGVIFSNNLFILFLFMPPEINQGFVIFLSFRIDHLNDLAFPPGNSFFLDL